jgi:hypothetical protein
MRNTPADSEQTPKTHSRPGTDLVPSDRRVNAPVLDDARHLIRHLVARTRRNWVREMWDWARCKGVTLPSVLQMRQSTAALQSSEQDREHGETESPIFLLAAGWRSGSTLLQRIIVTDPNVLLWGEPLGELAMLSGMTNMLARLSTFSDLEDLCAPDDAVFSSLPTSWIATLCPPGKDFRQSLQALLTRWLAEPARQRGFGRWGFKEVRLGAAEATLLHWIYPKAKFVLLSRNPYDCYRSLADSGWHHLYHSRPDVRIDSAAGMAKHWNRIVLSWSELGEDFPAVRIRYEDLIAGRVDFRKLESWLGIEIREDDALSVHVSSTARRRRVGWCERLIISREAAAGMRFLGY